MMQRCSNRFITDTGSDQILCSNAEGASGELIFFFWGDFGNGWQRTYPRVGDWLVQITGMEIALYIFKLNLWSFMRGHDVNRRCFYITPKNKRMALVILMGLIKYIHSFC
jgi:hypothetical protein